MNESAKAFLVDKFFCPAIKLDNIGNIGNTHGVKASPTPTAKNTNKLIAKLCLASCSVKVRSFLSAAASGCDVESVKALAVLDVAALCGCSPAITLNGIEITSGG